MPLTLNYLGFVTADLPRTLAFYRALGLPIPDGAHLNTAGKLEDHVEVAQGGLRIAWETEALARQLDPDWTPPSGQRMGIAFQAGSSAEVDETCERLSALGFAVTTAPYDAFWGQRYATLRDPDGNGINVFAWLQQAGNV